MIQLGDNDVMHDQSIAESWYSFLRKVSLHPVTCSGIVPNGSFLGCTVGRGLRGVDVKTFFYEECSLWEEATTDISKSSQDGLGFLVRFSSAEGTQARNCNLPVCLELQRFTPM